MSQIKRKLALVRSSVHVQIMCDPMTKVRYFDLTPPSMCDREPLVTLLYVGLWSGCYIPHCFVRLPLSEGLFESLGSLMCICIFVCFTRFVCLLVFFLWPYILSWWSQWRSKWPVTAGYVDHIQSSELSLLLKLDNCQKIDCFSFLIFSFAYQANARYFICWLHHWLSFRLLVKHNDQAEDNTLGYGTLWLN